MDTFTVPTQDYMKILLDRVFPHGKGLGKWVGFSAVHEDKQKLPAEHFVAYRLGYMRHDTLDSMESLDILFANGEIVAFNGFVEISAVARFLLYNDELQHECMTEPRNLKA
jgi:hypothetical protein